MRTRVYIRVRVCAHSERPVTTCVDSVSTVRWWFAVIVGWRDFTYCMCSMCVCTFICMRVGHILTSGERGETLTTQTNNTAHTHTTSLWWRDQILLQCVCMFSRCTHTHYRRATTTLYIMLSYGV